MSWLAIDTATSVASVAIGSRADDATEETIAGARRHAAELIPAIARALAVAGRTLDDLTGIVVADGPGSFTGLRVSAACAKAFAVARGLELRTVPSLLVRAAGAEVRSGGTVLAIADALRGDVYAAAYRFGPDGVETVVPAGVFSGADAGVMIDGAEGVVGDLAPTLAERAGGRFLGPGVPRAARMLDLLQLAGGSTLIADVHAWEPVYGRPAEAQAKWEREHGRELPGAAGRPR